MPDQVDLTSYGPRRVPGLRREEVAVLAGVSVPHYTRLERGNLSGVSESVLEAVARALQLDDAERAPLRPRTRGPAGGVAASPPNAAAGPAQLAAPDRRDDGCPSGGAERALGHPRRQHARAGPLLGDVRRPGAAGEPRPVRLPQPARATSTATGSAPPTTPFPSSVPQPAATPTTAICRTSPASSRLAATGSGHAGPRTTSASTGRARRTSTTRSSATSA